MNHAATQIDIHQLAIQDRIDYYEQELSLLSNPATFREKVLANVYRCLLQTCLRQYGSQASFMG
ncbi:hypothetical protein [Chromatium okenii]|jgi:hypothetical protein|uniref:Uncharacterized protein n=1 Tax=Chromatium okenii TaxID=61644 RepID=A0A2S7XTN3_9GAMM|nr:hypothetical protein [Chromatium okenii]MBV5307925.1 hypothetical protein [Chromatium okenii]PQJ97097.1 hypothetical protein CXB77_03750 [Chromatium okenii]